MNPIDSGLTEREKSQFNAVMHAASEGSLATLRVELNGVAKAALCDVRIIEQSEDEDSYAVLPLALLIDPATLEQITPPGDPEWITEEGVDEDE